MHSLSGLDTSNSKATVKLLLAHRADVKATDHQGQSVLHVAPTEDIANCYWRMALLIKFQAD